MSSEDNEVAAAPQPQALPPAGAPGQAAPAGPYYKPPKSPALAVLLSLMLPGVGQIYNGQPAKAFAFLFGFVGAIYGTAEVDPLPFAFLIPFVLFYNLIDAWRGATLINERAAGGGEIAVEDDAESPAWGICLVILGSVLLLNNLGWLQLSALRELWPMLLIGVGGWFVYRSMAKKQEEEQTGDDDTPEAG